MVGEFRVGFVPPAWIGTAREQCVLYELETTMSPIINHAPKPSLSQRVLRNSQSFLKKLRNRLPFVRRRQGFETPPVDQSEFATVRRTRFASRLRTQHYAAQAAVMREVTFIHRGGFR